MLRKALLGGVCGRTTAVPYSSRSTLLALTAVPFALSRCRKLRSSDRLPLVWTNTFCGSFSVPQRPVAVSLSTPTVPQAVVKRWQQARFYQFPPRTRFGAGDFKSRDEAMGIDNNPELSQPIYDMFSAAAAGVTCAVVTLGVFHFIYGIRYPMIPLTVVLLGSMSAAFIGLFQGGGHGAKYGIFVGLVMGGVVWWMHSALLEKEFRRKQKKRLYSIKKKKAKKI